MKVICINNVGYEPRLTVGKEYEIIKTFQNFIYILNDDERKMFYKASLFVTVEEYRDKKLNELGI